MQVSNLKTSKMRTKRPKRTGVTDYGKSQENRTTVFLDNSRVWWSGAFGAFGAPPHRRMDDGKNRHECRETTSKARKDGIKTVERQASEWVLSAKAKSLKYPPPRRKHGGEWSLAPPQPVTPSEKFFRFFRINNLRQRQADRSRISKNCHSSEVQ